VLKVVAEVRLGHSHPWQFLLLDELEVLITAASALPIAQSGCGFSP